MYVVYRITREDGQVYIGTTSSSGIPKRMKAHSRTSRFSGQSFAWDILEENVDYGYIGIREEFYINKFDTFYNGLNESINGKGNHLCPEFTTKGYKFSNKSRQKMSLSAKLRVERDGVPFKGKKHSHEQRVKWSADRMGTRPPNTKLDESAVRNILLLFTSKPHIDGVGDVMKNGRKMSYVRAFSLKYCDEYNVTPEQIERILKGKVWKNVKREYEI